MVKDYRLTLCVCVGEAIINIQAELCEDAACHKNYSLTLCVCVDGTIIIIQNSILRVNVFNQRAPPN